MGSVGQEPTDQANQGALGLIDEHLHGILLGIYSNRVDPIVRVLHWPSFLERCNAFRQGTPVRIQATSYPTAFSSGASFDALQPPASASTDATFSALLHSVYYAALASIIHCSNPPDLGQNVNALSLWSTFRRETYVRCSCSAGGRPAQVESLEMLQALVLYLVQRPDSRYDAAC